MIEQKWKAKWIWKYDTMEDCLLINQFAYFRKEFNITKQVRTANLLVSAHNHFELYAGGEKISSYVTPAPSNPQKSKFYLSYDVTRFLTPGSVPICSAVHYIGGDGQNYVNGLPGFILQCGIEYEDGSMETLVTDESWKVLEETPFKNGTEFQQKRKITAIEDYDANLEDGWLESGYDDNHWRNAKLSPINNEDWMLKPQTIPEGKIYEVIVPKPVGTQERGIQVFNAGKIITGWPRLEFKAPDGDTRYKGVRLMLRYSEDMTEDGRVKHNVCNEKSDNYYDLYTMKGGYETWEPSLSYKAFRYVEVTGYPELLSPEHIKIVSAGTGLSYEGSFSCSNPLLNSIYEACIQTQKNNVVGQMVDCPHREQAQYLADSDLQAETFIYNFNNPEVLKKVLLDFSDGQFEDGRFQFVYPSNQIPRFDLKIPEWDLHYVTLLWKTYYYYGDKSILSACYDTVKKNITSYIGVLDDSGLVPKGEGQPRVWNISDHPHSPIDHSGTHLTVHNCLLYHVLGLLADIAGILGFEKDEEYYTKTSQNLKESITKNLYSFEHRLFVDSLGSTQSHLGTNVVAYQYVLFPEKDKKNALEYIAGEGFGCSTLLSLNLLQVLFENGRGKEAYDLLNRTEFPSWGYMILQGSKTIWEGFQDIESHCHAWNAYPARIFVEYIVGIKATAPGFSKIIIKPYIPEDLDFAEGRVPTANGSIYVKWEKAGCSNIKLNIEIPANTCASVCLPYYVIEKGHEAKDIGPGKHVFYFKL